MTAPAPAPVPVPVPAPNDPVHFTITRLAQGLPEPIGRPQGYTAQARWVFATAALIKATPDGTMARQVAGYEFNVEPTAQELTQAAEALGAMAQACRKARWADQPVPRLGMAYFPERLPVTGDDTGQLSSQSVTPLSLLCAAHQAAIRTGLDAAGSAKASEAFEDIKALLHLSGSYPGIPPSMEQAAGAHGGTAAEYLLVTAVGCVLAVAEVFTAVTGPKADQFHRAARMATMHATSARAVIAQGVEYTLQGRGVAPGAS